MFTPLYCLRLTIWHLNICGENKIMKKWLFFFFHLFSWKKKSSWHMAAYVWRMGDKIIRLFYLLFGFDAFDTSKWNKTYHGISQGTLFSINHHVASNVDCNSYKCTFVVHIGKKQMNVKVTIVLVSYTPGPFFWDQINFNWAHKCEWIAFQSMPKAKQTNLECVSGLSSQSKFEHK